MSTQELRNKSGIEGYTKFWKSDSAKDTQKDQAQRLEQYTDVVNGYYDGGAN